MAKKQTKKTQTVEIPKIEPEKADDTLSIDNISVDAAQEKLDGEYVPEKSVTGAPKNFVIRCHKCRWARLSTGLKDDIADLHEIRPGCTTCGKWRKFHCQRCGLPAAMVRVRGNS